MSKKVPYSYSHLAIPDAVLLLPVCDPAVLYPDLVSALHGEAERGAAVPVLGGRHHPAVARQVRADAAVGEPAAAQPVAEHHHRPLPSPGHGGVLQDRAVHSACTTIILNSKYNQLENLEAAKAA